MPVGPYSQDVLKRIYNVQWAGGGVFIAINALGNIYYLKLGGSPEPAWEDLGVLDFSKDEGSMVTGTPQGCSYASLDVKDSAGNVIGKNPVFVLVGGGGNTNAIGIIMASSDGKNWSRVFSYGANSDSYSGASIWAVVWDDAAHAFFAAGHQSDNFSDPETEVRWMSETDLLFSSPDGFAWSQVGSSEVRVNSFGGAAFPPWPADKAGLLDPHCSKMVLDFNGYGTPDGNYGYDENGKLLIQPNKPMSINYLFGGASPSNGTGVTVTFSGEGVPPSYPLNPGLSAVNGVATAGGQWVVVGGTYDPLGAGKSEAAILGTGEDGESAWKRLDPPGTNAIVAICGGPLSDIEPAAPDARR